MSTDVSSALPRRGGAIQPETRYARTGRGDVAYQVVGDGPRDLVFVPGLASHLDLQWSDPAIALFLGRLASFSRLIMFDKRGTGLSDPISGVPTPEERLDDMLAVMDATGSKRAALFGFSEGGPMSILFSATYPKRTAALVLWGTFANGGRHVPEAYGQSNAWLRGWQRLEQSIDAWGQGRTIELMAPSVASGPVERRLRGLFERAAASPSLARAMFQAAEQFDVTGILSAVRVPTLVLHRVGDFIPVEAGRYLADHIDGARFVELPGRDHLPWLGEPGVVEEISAFVTGEQAARVFDRSLMTVLFTDIVDSTGHTVTLGDAGYRDLLERHEELVRRELDRFGGHEIDSAGDGFFMLFDGPARAISCALAIVDGARLEGLELRAGLHTGECVLGGSHVRGLTVHIGARVAALAKPGEILLTSTVKDITVGAGYRFVDRDVHALKGVPGTWHLFALVPEAPSRAVLAEEKLGRVDRAVTDLVRSMPGVARRVIAITRPSEA